MNPLSQSNNAPADRPATMQPAEADERILTRTLKIVSFPISAVVGYIVTAIGVRGTTLKSAIQDSTFKDIIEKHEADRRPNIEARIKGSISKETYLKREATIRNQYRNAADRRLEYMGHGGFLGKWNYISRSNRQKALIDGLTVSGITLGVLLTIADSKVLSNFFGRNKEKDDGQARPPQ